MSYEIRIYYESLEQGYHHIKEIIQQELKEINSAINIKLIKLKGNYKYYSKNIAPIIYWKDPDVLITIIKDGIEYPLLLIEYSNAVFTEDHELQRFDGLVAAAKNNCIYVKISPLTKGSNNSHGGNTNFNHAGPFSLIFKKFQKIFYHFNWDCNDLGVVDVDSNYLSIPNKLENFNYFINKLLSTSLNFNLENDWIFNFQSSLLEKKEFKKWEEILRNFSLPNYKLLSTSRTEWIENKKEFRLKFNRFGHAMDPERGMLAYYGVLTNNQTLSLICFNEDINGWYKDIPKENQISSYISLNGLNNSKDFLKCWLMGSGLENNSDFVKLVSSLDDKSNYLEIDLTIFLKNNYVKLNKALRTIFYYSTGFEITDKNNITKIKFIWNSVDFSEDYSNHKKITPIQETLNFDEDDITYISIHNILKINNYKILAVSYPGAQGDRVVLTEPGTGRSQKRKYIDIVATMENKFTCLQENKGKFTPASIQKEIYELKNYKSNSEYIGGFKSFMEKYEGKIHGLIKIGVGFWANKKFTIMSIQNLDMDELDYFIYISSDKKKWKIWTSGSPDMFILNEGEVNIPKTYEVI